MSTKVSATVIAAKPEAVRAAILDVESYPAWQREMQKVVVLSSDDDSRPLTARFDISAMGQAACYTLEFSYPEPNMIVTHLIEGDTIVKQDQTYILREVASGTELEYSLDIAVKWPIPEFMLAAIITKGIKTNVNGIKAVAESA